MFAIAAVAERASDEVGDDGARAAEIRRHLQVGQRLDPIGARDDVAASHRSRQCFREAADANDPRQAVERGETRRGFRLQVGEDVVFDDDDVMRRRRVQEAMRRLRRHRRASRIVQGGVGDVNARAVLCECFCKRSRVGAGWPIRHADNFDAVDAEQSSEVEITGIIEEHDVAWSQKETANQVDALRSRCCQQDLLRASMDAFIGEFADEHKTERKRTPRPTIVGENCIFGAGQFADGTADSVGRHPIGGEPLESMNDRMKEVLPNACFIAFTGTPIAKKEKSTFAKFGDLVQPTYSMRDAVADNAVVPLLYEGREVVTDVDEGQIDRWFEVHTRGLSDEQRADLKRKMSRAREIEGIESRLKYIAFEVGQHFATNFQGTGLKGQLAAPSKRAAIQLKKLFDDFGAVTTEVVISAPEMRESEDEVDEADDDLVRSFWRKMMERYSGEEAYNKSIVEQFKGPGDPEIIIVVDKLLTGFDAPRNTVLYVARRLKEHGLLQAIARVNRVFDEEGAPEKPFGYIIDYTGVFKNLGDALASYDALQGFNDEDIARSVVSIREEAAKVPGAHAALLDVFKSVSNTFDAEAYARLLADEAIRADFYRRLSDFSRAFAVALASPSFVEETKPEVLKRWKDDLGRFSSLRATVSLRYAERVDWRDYEKRVRQLLDRHVVARDVVNLVEPLNIFDDIAIEARRKDKTQSDASIADTIAHQLTRSIEEKWDEDPTFFEKFSKLIRDTIADFHKGRINELAYLAKVRALREKVEQRQDDANPTPARLRDDSHAQALWGLARRSLTAAGVNDPELAADIALEMSKKVQERRKVGWQNDRDIENLIRNDIDDFFFEELRGRRGIMLDPAIFDGIVDEMLGTARTRLAL